jgi:2-methylcitrate dehydratase PrpD
MTQPSYSEKLVRWIFGLTYADLPIEAQADAKLRVLGILGTTLTASTPKSSAIMRDGALKLALGDECRIFGLGDRAAVAGAKAGYRIEQVGAMEEIGDIGEIVSHCIAKA